MRQGPSGHAGFDADYENRIANNAVQGFRNMQNEQDAVSQMVAGARNEAGQEGFAAGEQSGANKAMDAILANQQAGLGNQQGQPTQQPQFTEQDVMQIAQGLQSGEITEEIAAQINQQMPGAIEMAVQMLEQSAQQQAPTGTPQAGLRQQAV